MLQEPGDRLASIQILRAFAAMGVVLAHLTASYAMVFNAKGIGLDFFLGNAGVDLFFVISGFIMVYASESLFGKPGASRTFMLRRTIRIVPLYWMATTYALWIYMDGKWSNPLPALKNLIGSYFFLPFPMPSGGPILIVGWTLNYEMFFYLVFALALAVALSRARAVVLATVKLIGLVLVGQWWGHRLSPFWRSFTNPLMLEFIMGMWIALAYRARITISPLVALLLLVAGLSIVALSTSSGSQDVHRAMTWGFGFAMVVAIVLSRTRTNSVIWAPVILLGEASYAIYLIHWFVLMSPPRWLVASLPPVEHTLAYSVSIVFLTLGIGVAVHFLVERPVTWLLRHGWRSRGFLVPRHAAASVRK